MKLNAASEQYFTRWEGKATPPRPPKTRLPWRPWFPLPNTCTSRDEERGPPRKIRVSNRRPRGTLFDDEEFQKDEYSYFSGRRGELREKEAGARKSRKLYQK